MRCGCFQGDQLIAKAGTRSLKGLKKILFTHYAEGPRFCREMNAPSATGCRISILRLFEPKVDFGAADTCRRGSTLPARMVFEMKILACNDDQLDINFHYCPLVAAWQSHGVTDEQIAKLCDISMQGDRGIAKSFGCELVLGETIAKGYSKCEIKFKRLRE